MKAKMFRFSHKLNVDSGEKMAGELPAEINRFISTGVNLFHVAQSSAILQTEAGLILHTFISVWYEERAYENIRDPFPKILEGDPKLKELQTLLKSNSRCQAVVSRRTLKKYPERLFRVKALLRELTANGEQTKVFDLAHALGTQGEIFQRYLDEDNAPA